MTSGILPYRVDVPQEQIDGLQEKLRLTRFPDELDNAGWNYGAPLRDVKKFHDYWRDQFDWRAAEKKLNDMPQFTTDVVVDGFDSINVHFVHKKSSNLNAIPLCFVHGWPGSFVEVSKIVDELSKEVPGSPSFHVVAPSLPNYGFSASVKKTGFGLKQYAETCHKLMQRLGYTQYVTQGGDWGYFITRMMGLSFPDHVMASHINMQTPSFPSIISQPLRAIQFWTSPWTQREKDGIARAKDFWKEGNGYFQEQSTKAQTIGYSLTDSPVGLLSWIYEKLHDWTDNYPWTEEEVCTWISIYWFSRAGPAASGRIYWEAGHDPDKFFMRAGNWIPRVKLGTVHFPKELFPLPKPWAHTMGDVVFQSEYDHGGHFAAWERPDAIIADLRNMFGKGGGAYGVVNGKTGY